MQKVQFVHFDEPHYNVVVDLPISYSVAGEIHRDIITQELIEKYPCLAPYEGSKAYHMY